MPKVNNKKSSKRRSNHQLNQQQTLETNVRVRARNCYNEIIKLLMSNKDVVTDECESCFIEHIVDLRTHLDIYSLLKIKIEGWEKEVDLIHKKNKKVSMSTHFNANAYLGDKIKLEKLLLLLEKAYEKRKDLVVFLLDDLVRLGNDFHVQCKIWKRLGGVYNLLFIPLNANPQDEMNMLWMKKRENAIRQWMFQNKKRTVALTPDMVYQYCKNTYKKLIHNIYKNINDQLKSYEQLKRWIQTFYDTELYDLLFNEQDI